MRLRSGHSGACGWLRDDCGCGEWAVHAAGHCYGTSGWRRPFLWSSPARCFPRLRRSWGLLLGGSLSHAVESSLRGSITDYICLRFWPAFNLADLALAAGAIGMIVQFLIAGRAMVF